MGTGNKSIQVEIENKSGAKISKIQIGTSENLEKVEIAELAAGAKASKQLSLKDNKADGSYSVELSRENGRADKVKTGYYSNGKALENTMNVAVYKDSIIVSYNK